MGRASSSRTKPIVYAERQQAGIKRKVDSVGWDACTATGSGKAGMCTHRVAHRCAPRCERLGLPDVKARGGVEVVRFGRLQPALPPSLGRYPASFSDTRPHDGKSPTGMIEREPAKPAKKTRRWTYNVLVDHGHGAEQAPIKVAPEAAVIGSERSCTGSQEPLRAKCAHACSMQHQSQLPQSTSGDG